MEYGLRYKVPAVIKLPAIMLLVDNQVNVVTQEELEKDSREVFNEDRETVEANIGELRAVNKEEFEINAK